MLCSTGYAAYLQSGVYQFIIGNILSWIDYPRTCDFQFLKENYYPVGHDCGLQILNHGLPDKPGKDSELDC